MTFTHATGSLQCHAHATVSPQPGSPNILMASSALDTAQLTAAISGALCTLKALVVHISTNLCLSTPAPSNYSLSRACELAITVCTATAAVIASRAASRYCKLAVSKQLPEKHGPPLKP